MPTEDLRKPLTESHSDLSMLKKFLAQALSNGVPGLDIDGVMW